MGKPRTDTRPGVRRKKKSIKYQKKKNAGPMEGGGFRQRKPGVKKRKKCPRDGEVTNSEEARKKKLTSSYFH